MSADPALVAQAIRALQSAELIGAISGETGLSVEVVQLGLDSSFHHLAEDLTHLAALEGERASRGFVSLAGNIFTACLRPFASAAVFGVPLLARVSSREGIFASALATALQPFCNIEILRFPSEDQASFRAAIESTDFCEAYGSDETIDALAALAPESLFVRRGHGIGVALLGVSIETTMYDALAEDIAAYDQRGCLSPRVVFADGDLAAHARQLDVALARIEGPLPRGRVPLDVQVASAQWRASAAALHSLYESNSHTVVVDTTGTFPLGPTHRHILLRPGSDAQHALTRLGTQTKVIGHTGAVLLNTPNGTGRLCPLGQMQRPRLSEPADGYSPGTGFIKAL